MTWPAEPTVTLTLPLSQASALARAGEYVAHALWSPHPDATALDAACIALRAALSPLEEGTREGMAAVMGTFTQEGHP